MNGFYNYIYRLRTIKRWGTSYNLIEENVAIHCFSVTIISEILSTIENEIFGGNINVCDVIQFALYHELFEAYTTHIVSPVKSVDTETKKTISAIDEYYTKKILSSLPPQLRILYTSKVNCKNNKVIEIVENADAIDAYCKCKFENMMGNSDYNNKSKYYTHIMEELKIKYKYVEYFFDNIINFDSFELIY